MTEQIKAEPGRPGTVHLTVGGRTYRIPKKQALDLAEKLKSSALKSGENDWSDIYRGFPNIWKDSK
ncbi:MAG TPA: hypothetical protein DCL06_06280 [Corynebacterium variabile]|uniref:Uncharacterized protein n=1 Tax=Corynebacterium variabile TaxID=1727 RepID=A0A3B9QUX0_9CORY|nr:hypothetical protein [Corynebacterium variabile]